MRSAGSVGPAGRVLAPNAPRPALPARTVRQREIATAARQVLEAEGPDAVTMRRLGDELGIAAPSLYKHLAGKNAVEQMLIEDALVEMGECTHAAIRRPGSGARLGPVAAVLAAYRRHAVEHPHLYRLATGPALRREQLAAGLEDWAGEPFYLVTGEPYLAQALWAFAHGAVSLEIDGRFADPGGLGRTWRSAASAFAAPVASAARQR